MTDFILNTWAVNAKDNTYNPFLAPTLELPEGTTISDRRTDATNLVSVPDSADPALLAALKQHERLDRIYTLDNDATNAEQLALAQRLADKALGNAPANPALDALDVNYLEGRITGKEWQKEITAEITRNPDAPAPASAKLIDHLPSGYSSQLIRGLDSKASGISVTPVNEQLVENVLNGQITVDGYSNRMSIIDGTDSYQSYLAKQISEEEWLAGEKKITDAYLNLETRANAAKYDAIWYNKDLSDEQQTAAWKALPEKEKGALRGASDARVEWRASQDRRLLAQELEDNKFLPVSYKDYQRGNATQAEWLNSFGVRADEAENEEMLGSLINSPVLERLKNPPFLGSVAGLPAEAPDPDAVAPNAQTAGTAVVPDPNIVQIPAGVLASPPSPTAKSASDTLTIADPNAPAAPAAGAAAGTGTPAPVTGTGTPPAPAGTTPAVTPEPVKNKGFLDFLNEVIESFTGLGKTDGDTPEVKADKLAKHDAVITEARTVSNLPVTETATGAALASQLFSQAMADHAAQGTGSNIPTDKQLSLVHSAQFRDLAKEYGAYISLDEYRKPPTGPFAPGTPGYQHRVTVGDAIYLQKPDQSGKGSIGFVREIDDKGVITFAYGKDLGSIGKVDLLATNQVEGTDMRIRGVIDSVVFKEGIDKDDGLALGKIRAQADHYLLGNIGKDNKTALKDALGNIKDALNDGALSVEEKAKLTEAVAGIDLTLEGINQDKKIDLSYLSQTLAAASNLQTGCAIDKESLATVQQAIGNIETATGLKEEAYKAPAATPTPVANPSAGSKDPTIRSA